MKTKLLFSIVLAAGACLASLAHPTVSTAGPPSSGPIVIAVVESGGMNVLHSDYKLAPGQTTLRLPKGMPAVETVRLPSKGDFEERTKVVAQGPLGSMEPGTLHRVAGTRIIGLYAGRDTVDITLDRFHATGTTAAAVGLEHGTNPNALLVFVPDASRESWEWLVKQEWIDMISTSYYDFSSAERGTCVSGESIHAIAEQGRLVFSAMGNGEQAGHVSAPAGYPDSYQVGGVDDDGRTFLPDGPTRPYETGDRYSFPSANADALTGSMDFGGTSGATPSTAGRAGEVITFARELLGARGGFSNGALATLGPGGFKPSQGPLKDGKLTRDELFDVMHHTATPAEVASPGRYLIEGYGAFQADAVALAKDVLAGRAEEPARPDEDRMHELVESVRPTFYPEGRC